VTCVKQNNPRDVYTHWNVESHWNEKRTCIVALLRILLTVD
jgi:hypothetical protein